MPASPPVELPESSWQRNPAPAYPTLAQFPITSLLSLLFLSPRRRRTTVLAALASLLAAVVGAWAVGCPTSSPQLLERSSIHLPRGTPWGGLGRGSGAPAEVKHGGAPGGCSFRWIHGVDVLLIREDLGVHEIST
ncbi:hypothetical protein PVAP13_7KG047135 [Panicum virgatum]|uniref:Uncharacterized protein n=1 Tax=Panicum virgatum TaxID=38727 RepID=A0A8T0Q5H3_PANVG|nr:hypothetical protein PVAP13_7KG047135 [Panicum virgatum]